MKILYCWRCRQDVPMLDEQEFAEIAALYSGGMSATKAFREQHGISLESASIHERFRPVREAYARLTGWPDMHQNAIMHHRISIYGPACVQCGKPLRTPRARLCAACGHTVAEGEE